MNRSDTIGALAKALSEAQGNMKFAKKDSANPFFKSKYADLASIVEAIRVPLYENQLSYVQATDVDDTGVVVETVLMHESGEWISGKLRMIPVKADPQGIGSCITYARRYGLQSLLGVPSDDDDGNAASGNITPTAGALGRLTAKQQSVINETAAQVRQYLADDHAMDAYSLLETSNFDADEKVAIWSLFDSKQRAALKRLEEAEKAAAAGKISPAAHKRLEARIKETGSDRDAVKARVKAEFGKDHLTDLNLEEYATVDSWLTAPAPPAPSQAADPSPSAAPQESAGLITEVQVLQIENALDLGGSVIRAKFRGVLAKNGWKEVSDIPAAEFARSMKWINTAIDKQNARVEEQA